MKGLILKAIAGASLITISACSNMTEIPERKHYAEPDWYIECAEHGSEGWFWWKEEYAYACGGGQSKFFQGAEEQMYAIAMNQFAKRIAGVVSSETVINIKNNKKHTQSTIKYKVDSVTISEQVSKERAKFKYKGEYYTFIRLKMSKGTFDSLVDEAKNAQDIAD